MNRRAFTLIELLVAMGIIVLLSAIALASTRNIRSGLRLSGGVNTVTAALELGRSLAIQNGEPVLVAFRPRVRTPDNSSPGGGSWPPPQSTSFVEITIMKWSGGTYRFRTANNSGGWDGGYTVDRWIPYPEIKTFPLPDDVCVAAPRFFRFNDSGDDDFVVTGDFVAFGNGLSYGAGGPSGFPFEVPAILFDRTGAVAVNNPDSSASGPWLDWDGTLDGLPRVTLGTQQIASTNNSNLIFNVPRSTGQMYATLDVRDEPFAGVSPFITIYDQTKALSAVFTQSGTPTLQEYQRDTLVTGNNTANIIFALREGRQISFNAYSGVVLK